MHPKKLTLLQRTNITNNSQNLIVSQLGKLQSCVDANQNHQTNYVILPQQILDTNLQNILLNQNSCNLTSLQSYLVYSQFLQQKIQIVNNLLKFISNFNFTLNQFLEFMFYLFNLLYANVFITIKIVMMSIQTRLFIFIKITIYKFVHNCKLLNNQVYKLHIPQNYLANVQNIVYHIAIIPSIYKSIGLIMPNYTPTYKNTGIYEQLTRNRNNKYTIYFQHINMY
eukprot:TRINITY_DN5199_c0_g1_i7.p2 TRINITY_DN5199_c0_g1~~TRINITY_DN5199_c0_g1_i7.p2  ORF type:complete len:225 (-),score=-22.38 TRINITY_DN5199_c0_g1_i7:220-894(-)